MAPNERGTDFFTVSKSCKLIIGIVEQGVLLSDRYMRLEECRGYPWKGRGVVGNPQVRTEFHLF